METKKFCFQASLTPTVNFAYVAVYVQGIAAGNVVDLSSIIEH